ncbi:tudor domain-containing protein 10 [Lissotriton helveticus]
MVSCSMETAKMSANHDHEFFKQTKDKKYESQKGSISFDRSCQVYVGNLSSDVTEEQIVDFFKDFNPLHVKKCQSGMKCFAFVDFSSAKTQQNVISKCHGTKFSGRSVIVKASIKLNGCKSPDFTSSPVNMPILEKVPLLDCNGCSDGLGKLLPNTLKATKACYAVPLEMRGFLLVNLLKDCFQELDWLASVSRRNGDAGLLITDTVPNSPFFWAVYLTEEMHLKMMKLFRSLAEAECKQPPLQRKDVKCGTRCLAKCNLGDEDAWNRCWVMEIIEELAVVFFVDFGRSATVLASSLRALENKTFWAIPPLTQPFMLQDGVFHSENVVGSILKGKINGRSPSESHILTFMKNVEE